MKLTVLVLDVDQRYLDKMLGYVHRLPESDIAMVGFTNVEDANAYLAQHTADIALISDRFAMDEVCVPVRETNCVKIVLSNTPMLSPSTTSSLAVFKFQPIRAFLENVKDVYYTYLLNKCNVIAFGSPIGGCGSSSVSIACAEMLSQHSRVIYISLELLGVPEAFFNASVPLSQQECEALLAQEITTHAPPLQSYAQIAEYCTEVRPGLYSLTLANANGEDMLTTVQLANLLQILKQVKLFDTVVLDLGAYFGAADQYALFDVLVVPSVATKSAHLKLQKLAAALKQGGCTLDACKVIYNKCVQDALKDAPACAMETLACIPLIDAPSEQEVVQELVQHLQTVTFV